MLTRKVEFSSCIISIEYIYTNVDKIKRVLAHVENCNILVNTLFVPKISAKFDAIPKINIFRHFSLVCGMSLSEP